MRPVSQPRATRLDRVLLGHGRVLSMLASGEPHQRILQALSAYAEDVLPDASISLSLFHQQCLDPVAPGSLPERCVEELRGFSIHPARGPMVEAIAFGERYLPQAEPGWPAADELRDLLAAERLPGSWSEPILARHGEVLGTLIVHRGFVHAPDAFERDFVRAASQVAGIAIEICRTQASLRESEQRFRQLAENIEEVFWLTDWRENRVLYVSSAYLTVWGRKPEELYRDPSSWADAIVPEDRERVEKAFREDAATGDYDVVYRIVSTDGNLRWIHDRAFPISNDEGVVERVCGVSADITVWKQQDEEQREADQRALASMTSELLLAEESERRILAVELHDGPNQLLTLTRMKLDALLGHAPPQLHGALTEISGLIREANQQTRTLSFQLSPPVLHDLGLHAAIEWLVEDIQSSYGLTIRLEGQPSRRPRDERLDSLLYRAVRELLINVAKHANANEALVALSEDEDHFVVRVEDDGASCEPRVLESGRGMGLRTIRERLTRMGGRMDVDSSPDRGTSVTLTAPL